jgi:putative transposase
MTGVICNWPISKQANLADLEAGEFNEKKHGLWTRGLLIRRNIADGDLDLPPKFRTVDYLRDWLPYGGSDAEVEVQDEQMVGIIREADRDPIGEVAKRHGVSEQTISAWRKRFGELRSEDVRRLRQLEAENARLKKLVAERDLEIEVMKEVAAKNW